jgi:hypothetical protein
LSDVCTWDRVQHLYGGGGVRVQGGG